MTFVVFVGSLPGLIVYPLLQLNAYVEHHAMFEGRKYRGDLEYLRHFITITVHFTALYIRHGYGRRSGHGPWPHTG